MIVVNTIQSLGRSPHSIFRPLIVENKKRQTVREEYFDGDLEEGFLLADDPYSDESDSERPARKATSSSSSSHLTRGGGGGAGGGGGGGEDDPLDCIIDMREYDVPYTMRAAIDMDLRVGAWYVVTPEGGSSSICSVEWQKDMLELCEPRILAFDIECEKSPLKFPNVEVDRIYMISYMVKGQGYLIINRFPCSFTVDTSWVC